MTNTFIIPYETQSELLRLLDSKDISEMHEGLLRLKDQFSSLNKSAAQIRQSRSVLYEYVRTHAELDHFAKLWNLVFGNEECKILRLPLIRLTASVLESMKAEQESFSSGESFSLKLIDGHLQTLQTLLGESDTEQSMVIVSLLTTLCKFSLSVARHLFYWFDFASGSIARLIGKRGVKDSQGAFDVEPRHVAITFVVSFFEHQDSYLKLKMLDNSVLVYSCFTELINEEPSFLVEQIRILRDCIMLDGSISRNRRVSFFVNNKSFLHSIVELYFHSNPQVVDCLDSFLRTICISPGKLLHFQDGANKALFKIISLLRPLENVRMANLFADILALCPELQQQSWNDGFFNFNLDDKEYVPLKFMASASICLKVLRLPIPSLKEEFAFQYAMDTCCQASLSKQMLVKLLSHQCQMVKYYAILICLALFDRFDRIIKSKLIADAELLDDFMVQFHRRIAEFQTIQSVYNGLVLSKSTSCQQLIATKLFRLIQFYFVYFNGTFVDIKFDPFKYLLDKYELITNEVLLSLLPLLRIAPFKVLEKRAGKSVLSLVFNLFRNFPCLFEQLVEFVLHNTNISGPFEKIGDIYFICLKLRDEYDDYFVELLETAYSEYFKSKATVRINPSVYEKHVVMFDNFQSVVVNTCLNFKFVSELFIVNSLKFLLNPKLCKNQMQSASVLQLLFRLADNEKLKIRFLTLLLNDENLVKTFQDDQLLFHELVKSASNYQFSEDIATTVLQNSRLNRAMNDAVSNCLMSNSHLEESWTYLLPLLQNISAFDQEKFLQLIVIPSESLLNSTLIQRYFQVLVDNCNMSFSPFADHILPYAAEPFRLFELFLSSQNIKFESFVLKLISFNYQSLCYAIQNRDRMGVFDCAAQSCGYSLTDKTAGNNSTTCMPVSPITGSSELSDEDKITIVQSFGGTTSTSDIHIYNLIKQYEAGGQYFGDFLLFFGQTEAIKSYNPVGPNDEFVLLKNAIANLDFKLMRQTCEQTPFVADGGTTQSVYIAEFLVHWIRLVLHKVARLCIVDDSFINLFIESHCLSFLCACLCDPNDEIRLTASHSIRIFSNMLNSHSNQQYSFIAVGLEHLENLMIDASIVLPSVYAHFFAKAFLVLHEPSHLMFTWICRLFLRKPYLHLESIGVFLDIFHSFEKTCRLWLLGLFTEGLKDEFSLDMYRSKRVIQLCMNGIDCSYSYLDSLHRESYFGLLNNAAIISPVELVNSDGVLGWIYGRLLDSKLSNNSSVGMELLRLTLKLLQCLKRSKVFKGDTFVMHQFLLIFKEGIQLNNPGLLFEILAVLQAFNLEQNIAYSVHPELLRSVPICDASVPLLRELSWIYAKHLPESNHFLDEMYFRLSALK